MRHLSIKPTTLTRQLTKPIDFRQNYLCEFNLRKNKQNRSLKNNTHISAEVVAVAEDPEEVGDEEGAKHEDGGEEGGVGVRLLTPRLFSSLHKPEKIKVNH